VQAAESRPCRVRQGKLGPDSSDPPPGEARSECASFGQNDLARL